VGGLVIRAMETPGHTPESLSYLIFEHAVDAEPWGIFTGDTLFVGDVGRVDILSSRLPVLELAGLMYDSLHQKLLRLPDATLVYPAHGAGSLCGRNMGKETWSTIGRERANNVALRPMSRETFIADITRDVPETPRYYLHSRDLNQAGPALDAERQAPPRLSPTEFMAVRGRGAAVIDTRGNEAYAAGHAKGAVNIALDGQFASWVGTIVAPDQPILLVADAERVDEGVQRLARVGYEQVVGVLIWDAARWQAAGLPLERMERLAAAEWGSENRRVLDVRRQREWDEFHLPGATHIPLSELAERADRLDRKAAWVVVCAGGYRSSIGASLLTRAGFMDVANGIGGMEAARKVGLPLECTTPQAV
jgi:rhodanese-related sulfurtransferase